MSRESIHRIFETPDPEIDERIAAGIEQNRKGYAFIHFEDQEGKPVPGVKVRITQKSHDFKYGANLFLLEGFESEELNQKHNELFADAFNIATLPFYWDTLEPEQGKPRFAKDSPKIYRRPAIDICMDFCEKYGIEPKAHCLNYSAWTPAWSHGPVEYEKKMLDKRFRELAERYADRIPMWEVTNETFWGWHNGRCQNFYYEPDFIEWSFDRANRYFPSNELVINEGSTRTWEYYFGARSNYYMEIERALSKGCRIDSIGMQFHMFFKQEDEETRTGNYYDFRRIYEVMDTYAKFGKTLQITEMTIPAYTYETEDLELQAEIIRKMYSIWFSHPAMQAIIYWNICDGRAYGALGDMTNRENYYRGALTKLDLTPKPAYIMIRDLFKKVWRTNTAAESDADGKAVFKGFYGNYELECDLNGEKFTKEIHLSKGLPAGWTFKI